MVYNTENGASLQKLPDKSQTSGNNCGCNCWKLKKKESKTPELFTNYLSKLAKAPSTIRVGRARTVKEMFMRKLTKN